METQPERQVEGFEMLGERNLTFCTKPQGKFNQDEKKKEREKVKIVMGSTENWDCAVKNPESPHSAMVEKKERR